MMALDKPRSFASSHTGKRGQDVRQHVKYL